MRIRRFKTEGRYKPVEQDSELEGGSWSGWSGDPDSTLSVQFTFKEHTFFLELNWTEIKALHHDTAQFIKEHMTQKAQRQFKKGKRS